MFIALRKLETVDGTVHPGDEIPTADGWSHGVQRSEVNCGNVYDLSRGVALTDRNSPTQHRRERDLIELFPLYGKQLIVDADGVHTVHSLAPVDPEQPIPADDEQPEPPRRKGRRG